MNSIYNKTECMQRISLQSSTRPVSVLNRQIFYKDSVVPASPLKKDTLSIMKDWVSPIQKIWVFNKCYRNVIVAAFSMKVSWSSASSMFCKTMKVFLDNTRTHTHKQQKETIFSFLYWFCIIWETGLNSK